MFICKWKRETWLRVIISILVILFIALILTFFVDLSDFENMIRKTAGDHSLQKQDEYNWVYDVLICSLAACTLLIAFIKLSEIRSQIGDDFLIRVDERWESKEKTKGRIYIRIIYMQHYPDDNSADKTGQEII